MMAHTQVKSKGASRPKPQQAVYELKRRVVLALNKLIDRDTYQIGVDELDKTVRGLSPEGISPFLSCILDIESEQKTAVRKECMRLMGLLVTVHETLTRPHLQKMVSSIVKRLKDADSVVRDACVETVGVLASKFGNQQRESTGSLVALVKPFFEALCEQNKQVQSGAALCLASAIDSMEAPPASVLQRLLARTTKMLKNPHFMAKPALLELNRSLVQAGGAPSVISLSTAVGSIREALQSSDWMTRKASAVALEQIGTNGRSFLAHCKASCVSSLESCRFDRVKPVRDAVLQALHCWRTVPDLDMLEPSGSVTFSKENSCGGEYSDLAGAGGSDSIWEVNVHRKPGANLVKKKGASAGRASKITSNGSKLNDWHAELAVSKTSTLISDYCAFEESEGSCATKTLEIVASSVQNTYGAQYDYRLVDDKKEDSHASNQVLDNDGNFVSVPHFSSYRDDEISHLGPSHQFTVERHEHEAKSHSSKLQRRKSLASTITNSDDSEAPHVHCLRSEKEIIHIRKQLLEIGKRQSCLMDLLQVFTAKTMESLSNLQAKVSGLEVAVDSMVHGLRGGMYSDLTHSRDLKSLKTPSHRSHMCNSRSLQVTYDEHSSVVPPRSTVVRKEKMLANRRDVNQVIDSGRDSPCNTSRFLRRKEAEKSSILEKHSPGCSQHRKRYEISPSASDHSIRSGGPTSKTYVWQDIDDLLDGGDLDSAYKEALGSRDGLLLIELLDRTGPVLEFLSCKIINDLLITLSSYLSDQGLMNTIFPWLQQIVELSAVHGSNCIPLSSKAKREILAAVHETLKAEASHPAGKRWLKELAVELQELWGAI